MNSKLHWAFALLGSGLFLYQLAPIEGLIGHDYYLALTELLIGKAHFFSSPFTLPHYTASLCGGLPFLADPQSTYFSLPQFISFFLAPYPASLLSYAVFFGIGYLSFLHLLRRVFSLSYLNSHFGALCFCLNGFVFSHLFVGHLTHHGYFLFPLILLLLWDTSIPGLSTRALSLALSVSYLFLSGGTHLIIVMLVMLVFLLPFTWSRLKATPAQSTSLFVLAISVTLLICAGKLAASYLMSQHAFHRPMLFSSEDSFSQFLRYFWFLPSSTPTHLPFQQIRAGAWEYVGFITKFSIPFCLLGIYFYLLSSSNAKRVSIAWYSVCFVLILWLATGRINSLFPFFEHYHNPIKFFAVLLVPILLLMSYGIQKVEHLFPQVPTQTRFLVYCFLSALVLLEYIYASNFFVRNKLGISFNPAAVSAVNQSLNTHRKLPPVLEVIESPGQDVVGLLQGSTSKRCYEPLFGYRWEAIRSQLVAGKSTKTQQSFLNLNHPGCFLYPEYFACQAWDRIPVSQLAEFESFIHGKPCFTPPRWHSILYGLGMLTSLFCVVFLCAATLRRRRKKSS